MRKMTGGWYSLGWWAGEGRLHPGGAEASAHVCFASKSGGGEADPGGQGLPGWALEEVTTGNAGLHPRTSSLRHRVAISEFRSENSSPPQRGRLGEPESLLPHPGAPCVGLWGSVWFHLEEALQKEGESHRQSRMSVS